MATNINQFRISIGKPSNYPSGILFSRYNIEANRYARRVLAPGTYKVYQFFIDNQAGYILNLSPTHVQNICDISKSTYERAIKELREKEFLIYTPSENGSTNPYFIFYEWPNNIPVNNESPGKVETSTTLTQKYEALGVHTHL